MNRDLFFRVSVNAGGAKYDLSADLTNLLLEEDNTQADQLSVDVSDPYKVLGHAFQEGMEVEVELGKGDDHSVMFRGVIYKVNGTFPETGVPTLAIKAYDKSMDMGLLKRNRPWVNRTLSQIVADVAQPYFPVPRQDVVVLGDPDFGDDGMRQQDETDLAFLLRLGGEFGCEMFVDSDDFGETLHFLSQKSIMERDPVATLHYGRCDVETRLLSFEPGTDVTNIQLPQVLSGTDYATGTVSDVTLGDDEELGDQDDAFVDENLTAFRKRYPDKADQLEGLLGAAEDIHTAVRTKLGTATRRAITTFVSPTELQQRRKNQFSTSRLGMRASGVTDGNRALHAQSTISLEDVGGRFSGTWYVSQVKHTLNGQGYKTEFQCQR